MLGVPDGDLVTGQTARVKSLEVLSIGMEEVLFEHEQVQSRTAIASLLRDVADKLDAGEPVTVSAGEESISLDVPANPTFETKVERETNGSEELSIEFELEWDVDGGDGDASLSIE